MTGQARSRRQFVREIAGGAALSLIPLRTFAAAGWAPSHPVQVVAPSEPGSGFDIVARLLQRVWQQSKLVDEPVTVLNKSGAFGALGWAYVKQHTGNGEYMAVMSDLIISNHVSGVSPIQFSDLTALAILQSNDIGFFVNSASPVKSGTDLIARLKKDPKSVSVAMSGVGGQNEITFGLILQKAGIDVRQVRIVGFTGSAAAQVAVLGGHVDLLMAPASSVAGQIKAGAMRGVGIASAKRMDGIMAGVPTWREQGIDVVFANWRGIAGPGDLTPAMVAYWDGVFAKTVRDPLWQDELKKEMLTDYYLDSTKARAFLIAQDKETREVLKTLGLSKN
ncbi:MAG TPA: tripartite tricarboxylate transporter substrate binding protein [Stellaceae bacterium]|nr:tripartite tricarboxylate transporter substrate binding protein [Stellaceae bacterium]